MNDIEEIKTCPLCGTELPYDKWLKVVGVYEEQQNYKKKLEDELAERKKQTSRLKEEYRKVREKERELKAQYNQKLGEERRKISEVFDKLKLKEKSLRSKLESQYNLRQEKLAKKYERSKQLALNQVKKEGIKIGLEKERGKTSILQASLEKLKKQRIDDKRQLRIKLLSDQEKLKSKFERQKIREIKRIQREGIKTGIEKQRARTEKVAQMADKYRKARDKAIERAKELEEMIKKGTTPQMEGLDFERELAAQLRSRFPEDEIKQTGKKGDIIQTIRAENKKMGKIIYECKKTKEFQNKFVDQIRRDKNRAIADYGLIVTWATKENKQGFWVEGDIIIVHPYGALDVASFLRETIVQMYSLRLSRSEFENKGRAILNFMQSEEFRSRIQDSIAKSREAWEILQKEIKTHLRTWIKRKEVYESIYRNAGLIQGTVKYVLLHGRIPSKILITKEFPSLPVAIKDRKSPS
jgi:hypothetical protein